MSFDRVSSRLAMAALAALLLLPSVPVRAEDAVVAKLNGQDITESDLVIAEGEVGNEIANLPAAARRRVLVEYIIETRLFGGRRGR